jgi:hypothetical protein
VFPVHGRVAGKRQPGGADALISKLRRPVALGRKDKIEMMGLAQAPREIYVRIDRPKRTRPQNIGPRIAQPVVDIQIQVKPAARDAIKVRRQEVLYLGQFLERTPAVSAGSLRPSLVIKDESNPLHALGTQKMEPQRHREHREDKFKKAKQKIELDNKEMVFVVVFSVFSVSLWFNCLCIYGKGAADNAVR